MWLGSVDPVMRQSHKAGEKLFIDYAGDTIPVVDAQSGAIREAQLFLAVLGASSYTYAEATWTQNLLLARIRVGIWLDPLHSSFHDGYRSWQIGPL
jgi:hypothetical protein